MTYMKKGCWLPEGDTEGLVFVDTFNDFGEIEPHRYHLYVSLACPFAHRALLVHSLLGLEEVISVSSVSPKRFDNGWAFDEEFSDPLFNATHLQSIYTMAKPDFTGRITVPVLWDKKRQTIASNDSAGIAHWLAQQWQCFAKNKIDLLPEVNEPSVSVLSDWINEKVNLGVYGAGFATEQAGYERAFESVFDALDLLELRLSNRIFLHGDSLTMSDIRLIPSLLRFDSVYYFHFKLNKKRIQDYHYLWRYCRAAMDIEAIAKTVYLEHIKAHYFYTHDHLNPSRIIPVGPDIDWRLS
ncbi:glutathione-dependent reductase [Shewanella canadensis]|uniref:Glutathione-dependent reductase n=1 Tax=Shewanella canadensis TaxID=271096 RepID=A0A3S0RWQ1_9GAMM|nr:glutathione S-transferase C-terminal domain-containing protein [Shewanella canadensis]RTR37998.1 glutathione-dependent reductase [Shewanella canadensis]